jgi:predicted phosphodiesterase
VIAILSDIHSNWEAFSVVMERCEQLGVKQFLCLGDVIGYGPDPLRVARIASERFAVSLMGNHEEALVTGKHRFNPHAAQAIDWTRQQIRGAADGNRLWEWFQARKTFAVKGPLLMVHGSIYDPVHDYVDEPENPIEAQQMIDTLNKDFSGFDICFAGHNHTPFMATTVGIMVPHDGHHSFRMPKGHKAYVCVGSVGQPRDRDPRASFATLDGEELTFHRLAYDREATKAKIRAAGLNEFLAERLDEGI